MRFRLRSLFLLVFAICVALAAGRWWFATRYFTAVETYPNGDIMHRFSLARDWRGQEFMIGKQTTYYPNGERCVEYTCKLWPRERCTRAYFYVDRAPAYLTWPNDGHAELTWYLPDGTEAPQTAVLDHFRKGKSTFHAELLKSLPHHIVWSRSQQTWRHRKPYDGFGRIQP